MLGLRTIAAAPLCAVALVAAGLLFGTGASTAEARNRMGGQPAHDPVTGYLCVTNNCNVVRLPDAYCICEKVNPGEQRLSRLRLACYTKSAGQWLSCPVRPRYGTMVN